MRFDLWYEHAVLTQPATLNVSLNWNWSSLLKACNLKHLITNYPEIKLFKISIEQGAFLNTYLVSLLQRPQRFFKVFIELHIYIYIPQKLIEFRVRKARAMVCLSIFVFLSIIKESYVVPTMLPDTVRYEIQWNHPENLFEAGKKKFTVCSSCQRLSVSTTGYFWVLSFNPFQNNSLILSIEWSLSTAISLSSFLN